MSSDQAASSLRSFRHTLRSFYGGSVPEAPLREFLFRSVSRKEPGSESLRSHGASMSFGQSSRGDTSASPFLEQDDYYDTLLQRENIVHGKVTVDLSSRAKPSSSGSSVLQGMRDDQVELFKLFCEFMETRQATTNASNITQQSMPSVSTPAGVHSSPTPVSHNTSLIHDHLPVRSSPSPAPFTDNVLRMYRSFVRAKHQATLELYHNNLLRRCFQGLQANAFDKEWTVDPLRLHLESRYRSPRKIVRSVAVFVDTMNRVVDQFNLSRVVCAFHQWVKACEWMMQHNIYPRRSVNGLANDPANWERHWHRRQLSRVPIRRKRTRKLQIMFAEEEDNKRLAVQFHRFISLSRFFDALVLNTTLSIPNPVQRRDANNVGRPQPHAETVQQLAHFATSFPEPKSEVNRRTFPREPRYMYSPMGFAKNETQSPIKTISGRTVAEKKVREMNQRLSELSQHWNSSARKRLRSVTATRVDSPTSSSSDSLRRFSLRSVSKLDRSDSSSEPIRSGRLFSAKLEREKRNLKIARGMNLVRRLLSRQRFQRAWQRWHRCIQYSSEKHYVQSKMCKNTTKSDRGSTVGSVVNVRFNRSETAAVRHFLIGLMMKAFIGLLDNAALARSNMSKAKIQYRFKAVIKTLGLWREQVVKLPNAFEEMELHAQRVQDLMTQCSAKAASLKSTLLNQVTVDLTQYRTHSPIVGSEGNRFTRSSHLGLDHATALRSQFSFSPQHHHVYTPLASSSSFSSSSSSSVFTVSVQDTGIGISADAQKRIFQPFTQSDSSITRRFGGTGLGLYLSQRLATLMNGSLKCISACEKGSTFTFTVPCRISAAQEKDSESPTSSSRQLPVCSDTQWQKRKERCRVLIVDDMEYSRFVLDQMLRKLLGFQHITTCSNGQEALDLLTASANSFDIVISDVQMPLMDGLTAVSKFRQHERAHGLVRTPVVMLTGNSTKADEARSQMQIADSYLLKPVRSADLETTLRLLLCSKKLQ
eukprot:GILK01005652.1.p1 GENE.GILK01005652.1~~GILK01005652.1.p1  ORF type:complete len:986 (-),score=150.99 GILK01005652.1:180-3137(-)